MIASDPVEFGAITWRQIRKIRERDFEGYRPFNDTQLQNSGKGFKS